MLGVIEARAGEPSGAGHRGVLQRSARCRGRADVEVLPDRRPEAAEVLDRPLPRVVVALERETPLPLEPAQPATHARPLPGVRGRLPHDLGCGRGRDVDRVSGVAGPHQPDDPARSVATKSSTAELTSCIAAQPQSRAASAVIDALRPGRHDRRDGGLRDEFGSSASGIARRTASARAPVGTENPATPYVRRRSRASSASATRMSAATASATYIRGTVVDSGTGTA